MLKGRTEDMQRVMAEASVFALTSRHEGLPMVLIEAMTQGPPVVSFDCPRGPAEIVVDGQTGRLVEDGDIAEFSRALLALMGNAGMRRRMSSHAREHAGQYQPDQSSAPGPISWRVSPPAVAARVSLETHVDGHPRPSLVVQWLVEPVRAASPPRTVHLDSGRRTR